MHTRRDPHPRDPARIGEVDLDHWLVLPLLLLAMFPAPASAQGTPEGSPGAISATGKEIAVELAWQSTGGPDPLFVPTGLAFDPDGNLWVTDTGNNRFQILTPEGEYLETWGEAGEGDGQFNFYRTPNNPGEAVGDIAFAPDGSFYVSSAGNGRIQHFSTDREFLHAWGSEGEGDGQFLDPFGIAVAPDGNVYVVDDERGDIQVFDPEGTYLFTIGEPGNERGHLNPGVLTIDADGNVYVADWGNHRVKQLASDGTFIIAFGEFGPAEGKFNHPEDIAVDQAGNIYVTEPRMNRVQVFTPEGTFLVTWSAADNGKGAFEAPVGIIVDADGGVYVTDIDANTVQKFEVTLPATPGATPVD